MSLRTLFRLTLIPMASLAPSKIPALQPIAPDTYMWKIAVGFVVSGAAGQHIHDGISGCLAPPCEGLGAADAFLDAATRALDASEPDGLLRLEGRLAAGEADWDGVLRRFEQHLRSVALAGGAAAGHAAVA